MTNNRFSTYSSFHQDHFRPVRSALTGASTRQIKIANRASFPGYFSPDFSAKVAETSKPVVKTAVKWLLNSVVGIVLVVGLLVAVPYLYYTFMPADTEPIRASQEGSVLGGSFEQGTQASPVPQAPVLPPQDPSLPEGEWLIIPKIGVRTQLQATANPDEALDTGVWLVPEYGRPGSKDMPMILAAHRFGWKWWWQDEYWKYHSFYLLPELQPGDIVETISDQRKYYYEIYAGEEGEEISDYHADLILYTCKFLSSPLRHFRYARLVDPTQNTQVSNR